MRGMAMVDSQHPDGFSSSGERRFLNRFTPGSGGLFCREGFQIAFLVAVLCLVYSQICEIPWFGMELQKLRDYPVNRDLGMFFDRMISWRGLFQRPLSIGSVAANFALFGDGALSFRLVNAGIHVVNSILLFCIAKRFVRHPLVPALLFGLHPLAIAVTAQLFGRSYSLGLTFMLVAFWVFLKAKARGLDWGEKIVLGLLIVMMLLSKQTFLFFFAIIVWAHVADKGSAGLRAVLFSPWSAVVLLTCGLFVFCYAIPYAQDAKLSSRTYLFSQLGNFRTLAQLYLFPTNVSLGHELRAFVKLSDWGVMAGGLSAVVLIAMALGFRRRSWGFLLGCLLLSIAPTNSIVPKDQVILEYRLYPSMVFFALLFGVLIETAMDMLKKKKVHRYLSYGVPVAAVGCLGMYGVLTFCQLRVYHSEIDTYKRFLAFYPKSKDALATLGALYFQKKEYVAAAVYLEQRERLLPRDPKVAETLAEVHRELGGQGEVEIFGVRPGHLERAKSERQSGFPDLVAVKGGSPAEMFEIGIAAIGGMGRFVKKGQTVVVKPNIAFNKRPEQGANTNPGLVGKIVELAYRAGAKRVYVFDNTLYREKGCYETSGIKKAVSENGGDMRTGSDEMEYRFVQIPGAKTLTDARVHKLYLESDVIINVPILKTHGGTRMTAALKNLMGVVLDRKAWHRADIHECIAEFPLLRKPNLTVIDAYLVMMQNGPLGLSPDDLELKKMQLISTDMVLADTAAAKILGIPPESIGYLKLAERYGIGTMNLEKRSIRRLSLNSKQH